MQELSDIRYFEMAYRKLANILTISFDRNIYKRKCQYQKSLIVSYLNLNKVAFDNKAQFTFETRQSKINKNGSRNNNKNKC